MIPNFSVNSMAMLNVNFTEFYSRVEVCAILQVSTRNNIYGGIHSTFPMSGLFEDGKIKNQMSVISILKHWIFVPSNYV